MVNPLLAVVASLLIALLPATLPMAGWLPPLTSSPATTTDRPAPAATGFLLRQPATPEAAPITGLSRSGVTVEIPIAAGSDDAGPNTASDYPAPTGCEYGTSWNEIYFGVCASGEYVVSGFRFADVPAPAGATILDAHVRFTLDSYTGEEVTVRFYGEATGDAAAFSATDRPQDRPVNEEQFTEWYVPASEVWTLGETKRIDVTAVVQAIIDRPDWRSGNAMAIIARSVPPASGYWHSRRVIGFERPAWYPGSQYAARLVITYAPRATGVLGMGSIQGTIWHDTDGDRVRDAAEPGLAGVQVCAGPLGRLPARCAASRADGAYMLAVPAPGTYVVAVTGPPAGMTAATRGFAAPVALRPGQQVTGVDFGCR